MSKSVELLNVFLASPRGLDRERKAFLKALREFNGDDAYERGFCFAPRGWQSPTRRAKHGKDTIDEQIRRSDYFVLVLHDQWGTQAGANQSPSGTEHEYRVALECLMDRERPMRDVVILFKGVDQNRLLAPEEDLLEVLAFRNQVEAEKSIFGTFDTLGEFRRKIRRQLHRWVRDREDGPGTPAGQTPPFPPPAAADATPEPPSADGEVVQEARERSKLGLHSEAESLLAPKALENSTSKAGVEWARVLRRAGRTALAEETSEKLLRLAKDLRDHDRVLDHYANLGLSLRRRGEIERSLQTWEEAIKYGKAHGRAYDKRVAFLLDNLGLTARKAQNLDYARACMEEAIGIRRANNNRRGLAHSYNNLGLVERDSGDLEAAEEMHRAATRLFAETGDSKDQAVAAVRLAAVLEQRGDDPRQVSELYNEALRLSKENHDRRGEAVTHAQLARSFLEKGDVKTAEREADESLMLNEQLDDSVGLATTLELVARIRADNSDTGCALDLYDEAFRLFSSAGHELGATGVLLRIGNLHAALGHLDESAEVVEQLRKRHGAKPPPRLRDEFEALVAAVERLRENDSDG